MDIHYLGHAAFELSDGATTVLIDPFITGNPSATVTADELSPDVILLTHGHGDHYGDVVPIAKRSGATVVAITEIAGELQGEGLADVRDPNIGGTVQSTGVQSSSSPPGTPRQRRKEL
jgi:L-ascorbate metabolism protein UlaG (beta-lactamase superfamily)